MSGIFAPGGSLADPLNLFGKPSGGGDSGMGAYLDWLKEQAAQQQQTTAREQQQADTSTSLRRNELLDRTGFSGDVMVGDAVKRTDTTLSLQMASLDPTDPTRVAYDKQIAQEQSDKAQQERIVTGEQYQAEDAFNAIVAGLGAKPKEFQLTDALAQIGDLSGKYNWYDTSSIIADIQAKLSAAQAKDARIAAARAAAAARSNGGGGGSASGGGAKGGGGSSGGGGGDGGDGGAGPSGGHGNGGAA